MRILIDILHPAHVHIFRNFYGSMLERGHELVVTSRQKDVTTELLDTYQIPHTCISTQGDGAVKLAAELVSRSVRLARIVRRFRPDVLMGVMGPAIAVVGKLTNTPSVVFYDTEFAPSNRWVYPLASAVCTPESYYGPIRSNQTRYPGYHELAYLHPTRFEPRKEKLEAFGIDQPFAVLRFISWQASHDFGETGLAAAEKLQLARELQKRFQVVISSEGELPPALEEFRLRGPITDIHHVLAFAEIVVGESPTMASEAGLLGTRSILIGRRSAGVLDDQEKLGIITRISTGNLSSVLDAIESALARPSASATRAELLAEKVDLTAWMMDWVEGKQWE